MTIGKTNQDWDYCKLRKSDKPRTFACIIKDANEDSPVDKAAKIEVADCEEIPLTNYDEKYKLLATNPGLPEVQRWIMGCIRYCDRGGQEQWYQHSTDGWWIIDNVKNMPFGSGSANSKFGDTTFLEIMTELKDSEVFNKRCRIAGSEFWPFYEEAPRTDIINTFNGWPFKAGQSKVTKYVEFFRDYILGLFGKEPGQYVLNTLTKKLRFPRWKGSLIIGFGRFGGEGKNATEALLTGLFGKRYVLSCIGTKHILGQGDALYNPMIENKLLAFVQEAGSKGKSIADEEAFKSWLSEDTQALRRMKENPRIIANMVLCFMWTNNFNCVNMTGPMARRTMAQRMNDQYMENTELFDEVWAVSRNDVSLQEIFDWLIDRDISSFVSTDIPDTDFKNQMKEESMTPIQRYVVETCNGDRPGITADKDGSVTYPYAEMYQDFRSFCQTEGMTKIMQSETFKSELKNMDCVIKQARYSLGDQKSRPVCVIIDGIEMEKIMRKFLKDKEWKLLRLVENDEDELA